MAKVYAVKLGQYGRLLVAEDDRDAVRIAVRNEWGPRAWANPHEHGTEAGVYFSPVYLAPTKRQARRWGYVSAVLVPNVRIEVEEARP